MRYLKLYESVNYEEISFQEYLKLYRNRKLLSQEESSSIEDYYNNTKKYTFEVYKDIYYKIEDISDEIRYIKIVISVFTKSKKLPKFMIYINNIDDDYFLFKIHDDKNDINKYYKCDQLIGLLKCVKHINNIYKI